MAEAFGDDLGGYPGVDEQGGVGVAQVVKSDEWHTGAPHDPFEGLRNRMGVEWLAGSVGEHPAVVLCADGCQFVVLPGAPRLEEGDGSGVDVDAASGVAGLAAADPERVDRLFSSWTS